VVPRGQSKNLVPDRDEVFFVFFAPYYVRKGKEVVRVLALTTEESDLSDLRNSNWHTNQGGALRLENRKEFLS